MDFGLQVSYFSWPGAPASIGPAFGRIARNAEDAGLTSLWVMDHFFQISMIGPPELDMLEGYSALAYAAALTSRIELGTLVTGNTYRNPTLLAKAITTLDVISQGRAILGIGTGWFELEHDSLGYDFGTFTDRFNRLNESLQIVLPMLKGEHPTFSGQYYRTVEAMANPRFRDHIPLLIGGRGEKKTIPLAARHFDHLNIIGGFDELPHKLGVVRESCEKIDRDPATLETSMLLTVLVDDRANPDVIPEANRQNMVAGSAESVAEQLKAKVFDVGVDGVIVNIPTQVTGFVPGVISALGAALHSVIGA